MDSIILFRQVLSRYQTKLYKRGVTVVDELGQQPLELAINDDDLKKVLSIFVDNAVHFNRPNGKLIVSLLNDENNSGFILADTGIGIEPKVLKQVTKRQGLAGMGETNLEKAIDLVEQFKGTVAIESQHQVGTQVTLRWKK